MIDNVAVINRFVLLACIYLQKGIISLWFPSVYLSQLVKSNFKRRLHRHIQS